MWHDNETTVEYVKFRLISKSCRKFILDISGRFLSAFLAFLAFGVLASRLLFV